MLQFSAFQAFSFIITAIALSFAVKHFLQDPNAAVETQPNFQPMTTAATSRAAKSIMSTLSNAKIVYRPSSTRGHANHGWLNTYHSFSFANWYDPRFESFGSLRVLNEDRVAPSTGFPTHPHRDAEIFSYILSGELTHRDSMQKRGAESNDKDKFFRMHRDDVQFTTGGTGIAHSEQNEHNSDWVHFLQIWATPWKRGLRPTYHTNTFPEANKRDGFVSIITPLKAGKNASAEEEKAAVPVKQGTIPVHADLVFSAGIIAPGKTFEYTIGENALGREAERKTYVHLPMTKGGKAKVKIDGREGVVLSEGDGAFVSAVNTGDVLRFESVGTEEAEVVVLDSN